MLNINNIQKYLINSNIPYHFKQFINFLPGEKLHEPHFIIPGAIILSCSRNRLCHSNGTLTLEKKFHRYYQFDFKKRIYICIHNKNEEDDCLKLFEESGINSFGLDIIVINQLTDIKPKEYNYCIDSCGPLYTLAMLQDKNIIAKHINYLYHVPKYEYDRATTYMNQIEIDNMKRFNFKIVDNLSNIKYRVNLINKKTDYGINFFQQFYQVLKYIPLPGGTRPPITHIKGHTIYCKKCQKLFNHRHVNQDDICVFCIGHKIKKL
jgi:hypothetical protein